MGVDVAVDGVVEDDGDGAVEVAVADDDVVPGVVDAVDGGAPTSTNDGWNCCVVKWIQFKFTNDCLCIIEGPSRRSTPRRSASAPASTSRLSSPRPRPRPPASPPSG